MAGERHRRILTELSSRGWETRSSARLCEVSHEIVGVTGAGVMLMPGDRPGGSLCASNDVSRRIEDLQYSLGEGPCLEAHEQQTVVLEPDLADPHVPRWLAFSPAAVSAGARAVFAFPMRVGSARVGALNLYRDRPGVLSDDQHADALVMADVAARWVIDMQADAPLGAVAHELEQGADFHFALHNAAGMVAVQLDVGISEALIRLRAVAFSSARPLADVAEDVIARRLRIG